MKLCFYGPQSDYQTILELMHQLPQYQNYVKTWACASDYDTFVNHLTQSSYNAAIITENNANGMEGVIALRNIFPELPVIWFSNDEGFGCQAYRLNADFFHTKPVTAPVLEMALNRLPHKST